MFCPLPYRDTVIIVRGLVLLIVVIILGVAVSARQLNNLTQWQEDVHAFTMECDSSGVYSISILGSSYTMKAIYSVGEIINNDKTIIIKSDHYLISMPTYIELDCRAEVLLLEGGAKLLITEGFAFKKSVELYLTGLPYKLNVYIGHFR